MEKTILVADDEPAVALALEEFFRLKGYTVLRAFYGDQAVEQIQANQPALVVLDLHMPKLDGIGVLREIRANHPGTRTLVITGQVERYEKELKELSPEKVLVKPVSLEAVTHAVQELLGQEEASSAPAGGRKDKPAAGVRLLFVEGNPGVYERILKPYFENPGRSAHYDTRLATSPEEALEAMAEFHPQVVLLDGTRMPVGVNAGRLAADFSGSPNRPKEVILHALSVQERQGESPEEQLQKLEKAIQRATHAT